MKSIAPNNCNNQECPFWDKHMEEHCGSPDPQSEEWIEEYCDKQKLIISGSHSPDKLEAIANCNVFVALGGKHFFASAQNYAECLYAKELGKPFIVVMEKGTKVDESYFEGVKDITFYEWGNIYEKEEVFRELVGKMNEYIGRR